MKITEIAADIRDVNDLATIAGNVRKVLNDGGVKVCLLDLDDTDNGVMTTALVYAADLAKGTPMVAVTVEDQPRLLHLDADTDTVREPLDLGPAFTAAENDADRDTLTGVERDLVDDDARTCSSACACRIDDR